MLQSVVDKKFWKNLKQTLKDYDEGKGIDSRKIFRMQGESDIKNRVAEMVFPEASIENLYWQYNSGGNYFNGTDSSGNLKSKYKPPTGELIEINLEGRLGNKYTFSIDFRNYGNKWPDIYVMYSVAMALDDKVKFFEQIRKAGIEINSATPDIKNSTAFNVNELGRFFGSYNLNLWTNTKNLSDFKGSEDDNNNTLVRYLGWNRKSYILIMTELEKFLGIAQPNVGMI